MRYFDEVVGLRIYLALWVAIGHGLQLAGFQVSNTPAMRLLPTGHDAVVVFMIVSGFVITNLLIGKEESYPRYITRRFFRLYPAYVLCCVAGYLLADSWVTVVDTVAWGDLPGWSRYAASVHELRDEVVRRPLPHVALHATMLHGLVPVEVLNRAAMTFLPAAWSISLEWQFYLVAPLVLAATRRPASTAVVVAVALVVLVAYNHRLLGHYNIGASLAGATPAFAIGIASRLAYPRLASLRVPAATAAVVVVSTALALLRAPLPLAVWGVFLSYSLWGNAQRVDGRLFRLAFASAPVKLLGEASYSLYLVHRPVQVLFAVVALGWVTLDRPAMLAVQMAAILVALPLSLLMYFQIERRGIRWGGAIARRLPGDNPPARPCPAPVSA